MRDDIIVLHEKYGNRYIVECPDRETVCQMIIKERIDDCWYNEGDRKLALVAIEKNTAIKFLHSRHGEYEEISFESLERL